VDFPPLISVAKIDAKHSVWSAKYPYWERLRKLYEGGQTMTQCSREFLKQRSMEPNDVYSDRIERFSYINHLGNIAGWYVSALFKDPPSTVLRTQGDNGTTALLEGDTPETQQLTAWQDDCDSAGTALTHFWAKNVESKVLVYGECYVLFDLPVSPVLPSKAAQMETGALRPHLVSYGPQDVINWQCDERGNLQWLILKLRAVTQDDPFQPEEIAHRWYVFTQTQVATYEFVIPAKDGKPEITIADGVESYTPSAEANLLSVSPHALSDQGVLPIFKQCIDPIHWIADRVASPLVKLLNIENAHEWGLEQTNLAQLVLYTDTDIPKVTRGEATFLKLGKDDKASYLEQTGTAFDASSRRINELREEIYRLAYLVAQGRSSSASATAQSGISKEQDMLPARDVLSALGDQARTGIQRLLQCAADRMDLKVEVDVQGLDFLDRAELAELEVLERATTIVDIQSPRLEKELAKRISRIMIPDANREVFEEIDEEIESNPTASEQEQQQQQLLLSAKLSQASKLADPKAFKDVADAA
jgi:hypothetical protein